MPTPTEQIDAPRREHESSCYLIMYQSLDPKCTCGASAHNAKVEVVRKGIETLLKDCKEKLRLYRQHTTGEYYGGVEYTDLIQRIDQALAATKEGM